MTWFAYNVLFAIGYLLMLPYFVFRMVRRGGYLKGFLQRLCVFSDAERARIGEQPRVWVHAVSVGEIQIALRLIDEFRAQEPGASFLLTTTTSTGHAIASRNLKAVDCLAYFPVDFPFVVKKALALFRPRALILVEGELWPNVIRACARGGIPVFVVNGRMSDKSERGYKVLRVFFQRAINCVKLLCVQTRDDERRFVGLGASPERVRVMGSTKYDIADADPSSAARVAEVLRTMGVSGSDLLLVGGSTWPGEEAILVELYKKFRSTTPNLRLALVPRHAERAAGVAAEIGRHGLTVALRSRAGKPGFVTGDVILVDTTGELMGLYACASVVFVGKSLTEHGGQNFIEPAALGKPVIVGPHTENFPGVTRDFLDADAIMQVADAAGLEQAASRLLADAALRQTYGTRAAQLVKSRKGVLRSTVELVRAEMPR